jgi:flagellar basal-body rod protein FlgC
MSLEKSMDIVAQALDAHAKRLQIHANNVANADTPYYQRKLPIIVENTAMTFEDTLASLRGGVLHGGVSYGPSGVLLDGVMVDPTPGRRIYQPQHPEADAEGYVTLSNVNILSDMADATLSQRIYEANLSVAGVVKAMANRALELGRGQ